MRTSLSVCGARGPAKVRFGGQARPPVVAGHLWLWPPPWGSRPVHPPWATVSGPTLVEIQMEVYPVITKLVMKYDYRDWNGALPASTAGSGGSVTLQL